MGPYFDSFLHLGAMLYFLRRFLCSRIYKWVLVVISKCEVDVVIFKSGPNVLISKWKLHLSLMTYTIIDREILWLYRGLMLKWGHVSLTKGSLHV